MEDELRWRRWQMDAKRGIQQVRAAAAAAVDRFFLAGETLPLRMRLHHVDRQLASAYQALGRRVADRWAASSGSADAEKLSFQSDPQTWPLFFQIESLREERGEIVSAIHTAGETPDR